MQILNYSRVSRNLIVRVCVCVHACVRACLRAIDNFNTTDVFNMLTIEWSQAIACSRCCSLCSYWSISVSADAQLVALGGASDK